MLVAAIPVDEENRLAALHNLEILDTPSVEQLDHITKLAREEFEVAVSMVTLVDRHRQWFKSINGYDLDETDRAISFCAHTILEDACLIVPDLSQDPRFMGNPLVTEEPKVRFYAGCPIHDPTRYRIGTFCIVDTKPRSFDLSDIAKLTELARIVEEQIALDYFNSV
ncbi:MAG: GAF domain-containing protein [Pseudomonadota bacterium]